MPWLLDFGSEQKGQPHRVHLFAHAAPGLTRRRTAVKRSRTTGREAAHLRSPGSRGSVDADDGAVRPAYGTVPQKVVVVLLGLMGAHARLTENPPVVVGDVSRDRGGHADSGVRRTKANRQEVGRRS